MANNEQEKSLAQTIAEWGAAGQQILGVASAGYNLANQKAITEGSTVDSILNVARNNKFKDFHENQMALKRLKQYRLKSGLSANATSVIDDWTNQISTINTNISELDSMTTYLEGLNDDMFHGLNSGKYMTLEDSSELKSTVAGIPEVIKKLNKLSRFANDDKQTYVSNLAKRTENLYGSIVFELDSYDNLNQEEAKGLAHSQQMYLNVKDNQAKENNRQVQTISQTAGPNWRNQAKVDQESLNALKQTYFPNDPESSYFRGQDYNRLKEAIYTSGNASHIESFNKNIKQITKLSLQNKFNQENYERLTGSKFSETLGVAYITPKMTKVDPGAPLPTAEGFISDEIKNSFGESTKFDWMMEGGGRPVRRGLIPGVENRAAHLEREFPNLITDFDISIEDLQFLWDKKLGDKGYLTAKARVKSMKGMEADYTWDEWTPTLSDEDRNRMQDISQKISNRKQGTHQLSKFIKTKKELKKEFKKNVFIFGEKDNPMHYVPVLTYEDDKGNIQIDYEISGLKKGGAHQGNINWIGMHGQSMRNVEKLYDMGVLDSYLNKKPDFKQKYKRYMSSIPGQSANLIRKRLPSERFENYNNTKLMYVRYEYDATNNKWIPILDDMMTEEAFNTAKWDTHIRNYGMTK